MTDPYPPWAKWIAQDRNGDIVVSDHHVIGTVRFTTECGNCYEGTDNDGEPVWELWAPYYDVDTPGKATMVIEPDAITHWMPLPQPPGDDDD